MTEDQDARDPHSDAANKALANKYKDKKIRSQRPLTKIILRRLPPTMTEEAFLEQVSPIPEHDCFYFTKPDPSLGNNLYSRAYINFVNIEDIYIFRDKFDGYIFLDEKGVEYMGIVEYAPFQRIPKKKKKKDPKCGTIETDPIYQEFVENLTKEPETENVPKLEYSYPISDGKEKVQTTPLLDYLAARKLDKRGRDERRRRENDKRKMRIERKPRDGPIKISEEFSEDETNNADCNIVDTKVNHKNFWSGEERVYKSKIRSNNATSTTKMTSDELKNELNRDCHFPALSTKMHNTFTLSSNKNCDKKGLLEANQKNRGDSCLKEDESAENNEVKKIKPRDWDKDKPAPKTRDEQRSDSKDSGIVFESKSYRDRKSAINLAVDRKKKLDSAKEDDMSEDAKKDKRDKPRETAREQKSKKYSDTRKDRARQNESSTKVEKPLTGSKPEAKAKALNHDDIKPFTQLPQVKTDDLTKLIEEMDKKVKIRESKAVKQKEPDEFAVPKKTRRNSLESGEVTPKDLEESFLKRQKSLNDRREKSSEREDSEEKDREDGVDRRGERKDRIRNKDRPSLVIYQPGMGRFSKQRLAKEKSVNESEKKDT